MSIKVIQYYYVACFFEFFFRVLYGLWWTPDETIYSVKWHHVGFLFSCFNFRWIGSDTDNRDFVPRLIACQMPEGVKSVVFVQPHFTNLAQRAVQAVRHASILKTLYPWNHFTDGKLNNKLYSAVNSVMLFHFISCPVVL